MLSDTQLHHWRKILLTLRDRLDADSAQIRAEATHASGGESAGGLSNKPIHLADIGSQEAEAAETVGMAENEAMLVHEVEDALVRIQEGRFGLCEACPKAISRSRLKVLPYARYCVSCARKNQPKDVFRR